MNTPSNQARAIFLEAIEQAVPENRAEFVALACGADADLRARVERLLRSHEQLGSFHDAAPLSDATIDQPPPEQLGAQVGPYKLLQQIGEGGMGTVYMAEQTAPVQRKVALKLIKPGMDSRQVIARFEAERQALALMDHPHIAKVLDAGTTNSGLPYFVMELVKGMPITRYCDEHHLTPRQRLELFIPVCQAVQHAHQKGIIHRDLKPSNVLVALYDGKPVPKVIDFGVAKATGQRLTDKTLFTGFGTIVGTVEYMSPEQAEINQLDIDTRSDIYSLGVLLYELLAGSPPFSRKELEQAGMLEMLRVIREQEPSKPSTKLSTADGLPTLAANRGTEPAKLTRLVRGELDWIVMKALEKDRNRRYETANGFAMDVQRDLADEPVQACPPSAGYRLRKFARRNKGGLAVAALVLFFLVLMGSGLGWVVRDRSAREAEAARQQAAREAEAARQQGERQAKLAGQVESIFGDVDRLEQEQKWPEALEAARRAEAAVAGGEADEATARQVCDRLKDLVFIVELDHIREERAVIIDGKSNDAGAARRYAEAFRVYGVDVGALPAEESCARLQGKAALAVAIAAALDDWVDPRRELGEAEPRWKPLVAVARGLDPDPLRDRLRAVWGQPVTPELRTELLGLAESIDVKTHRPGTIQVLAQTLLLAARANAAQTLGLAQQLVDAARHILQTGQQAHPADFWLNIDLGEHLRGEEGLRYLSVAVSIRPDSARAHYILGNALRRQKEFPEAVVEYLKTIELDPNAAYSHFAIAHLLYHEQGKLDAAMVEFLKAIELKPKAVWADSAHAYIGEILRHHGKWDEAIAEYRKAIEVNPNNVLVYNILGNALRAKGDLDEAELAYREAVRLNRNQRGAAIDALVELQLSRGKAKEAIATCQAIVALAPDDAGAHCRLGKALKAKGDLDEADAAYRKALELLPDADRPDSIMIGSCVQHFRGLGDVAACRAATEALEKTNPADALSLYNAACCRALTAAAQTQPGGADAARLAKVDADRAMALLTKAVAAGFSDANLMRQDTDLDSLRQRGDFHSLLANVQAKTAPMDSARFYIILGQWAKAAAAYENVDLWVRPLREDVVFARACLYLIQGDSEGYDRFCRDMLQRVPQTEDHFEAFVLVRTCTMGRQSPVDPAQAVQWAKQAVAGDQPPWYFHALGLAQFRAGQFDEALQSFNKANVEAWTFRDLNWFGMALVHHRLGQSDEARQCLDKGTQWLERYGPPGPGQPANIHPMDWLEAHVLRREAEELIDLKSEEKPDKQ